MKNFEEIIYRMHNIMDSSQFSENTQYVQETLEMILDEIADRVAARLQNKKGDIFIPPPRGPN